MKMLNIMATVFFGIALMPIASAQQFEKLAYDKACASCHNTGIGGAPRLGDPAAWREPVAGGMARLYKSALEGTPKGMPPKGGLEGRNFTNSEIQAVVDYMVDKVKVALEATTSTAAPAGAAAAPSLPPVSFNFNRLLKPLDKRNLPPSQDGIHDPANDGTLALQPPLAGMADLVRSRFGNNVDWVASQDSKKITPRWERTNPFAEPMVMDLNIVRVPTRSAMVQSVVFPHKQHTELLDCSNCHPAIFVPQQGANVISMPLIMLGQKCGVCHGKVAFPVSECNKCHSQKRDDAPQKAAAKP